MTTNVYSVWYDKRRKQVARAEFDRVKAILEDKKIYINIKMSIFRALKGPQGLTSVFLYN